MTPEQRAWHAIGAAWRACDPWDERRGDHSDYQAGRVDGTVLAFAYVARIKQAEAQRRFRVAVALGAFRLPR